MAKGIKTDTIQHSTQQLQIDTLTYAMFAGCLFVVVVVARVANEAKHRPDIIIIIIIAIGSELIWHRYAIVFPLLLICMPQLQLRLFSSLGHTVLSVHQYNIYTFPLCLYSSSVYTVCLSSVLHVYTQMYVYARYWTLTTNHRHRQSQSIVILRNTILHNVSTSWRCLASLGVTWRYLVCIAQVQSCKVVV